MSWYRVTALREMTRERGNLTSKSSARASMAVVVFVVCRGGGGRRGHIPVRSANK